MSTLRSNLIRLAHENPELRPHLLPMLTKEAKPWGKLPKGWTQKSVDSFWNTMVGDAKHKVTKCIEKMEGKFDNPGAFCASLADKVEGKGWRSKKD